MRERKAHKKLGDCFEAAGRLAQDLDAAFLSVKLIHAQVSGQGKLRGVRFWHAWVETQGVALDLANGRRIGMRVDKYRAAGGVLNVREYEVAQALIEAVRSRHWGPWGEGSYGPECERCGRKLPACECGPREDGHAV